MTTLSGHFPQIAPNDTNNIINLNIGVGRVGLGWGGLACLVSHSVLWMNS